MAAAAASPFGVPSEKIAKWSVCPASTSPERRMSSPMAIQHTGRNGPARNQENARRAPVKQALKHPADNTDEAEMATAATKVVLAYTGILRPINSWPRSRWRW